MKMTDERRQEANKPKVWFNCQLLHNDWNNQPAPYQFTFNTLSIHKKVVVVTITTKQAYQISTIIHISFTLTQFLNFEIDFFQNEWNPNSQKSWPYYPFHHNHQPIQQQPHQQQSQKTSKSNILHRRLTILHSIRRQRNEKSKRPNINITWYILQSQDIW